MNLLLKCKNKALIWFLFVERAGEGFGVTGPVAGRSGQWIAEQAGVKVPKDKDVLLFELDKKNIGEALSSVVWTASACFSFIPCNSGFILFS